MNARNSRGLAVRRINLWAGAQAWGDATPQLRMLVVRGAKLPHIVADMPFTSLNADQILALAASAGLLAWSASEIEAMAPLQHDEPPKRGSTPFPRLLII